MADLVNRMRGIDAATAGLRLRRVSTIGVLLVVLSLLIGACGSDPSDASGASSSETTAAVSGTDEKEGSAEGLGAQIPTGGGEQVDSPDPDLGPGDLEWEGCGAALCATVQTPLDHSEPDGEQIDLTIELVPAENPDERVGVLFFNPGGPGSRAVGITPFVAQQLPETVRERFDVAGMDPRGLGHSTQITCISGRDMLREQMEADEVDDDDGDGEPDVNPLEVDLETMLDAKRESYRACEENAGGLLPLIDSQDAARDFDLVREALGEEKLTYLGWSYGTTIGAQYLALFPDRARAIVLDSVVDPALDWRSRWTQMAVGRELTLNRLLEECAAETGCAFHQGGESVEAFDRLLEDLRAEPLPLGDDAQFSTEDLLGFVAANLYGGHQAWDEQVLPVLEAASARDGASLRQLLAAEPEGEPDVEDEEPDWENIDDVPDELFDEMDMMVNQSFYFDGVICEDWPIETDLDGFRAALAEAEAAAPHFGDLVTAHLGCLVWPYDPSGLVVPEVDAGPPVLVLNPTHDPATPLVHAENVAGRLDRASLLTTDSAKHIAFPAGIPCIDDAVTDYLVSGALPEAAACGVPADGG